MNKSAVADAVSPVLVADQLFGLPPQSWHAGNMAAAAQSCAYTTSLLYDYFWGMSFLIYINSSLSSWRWYVFEDGSLSVRHIRDVLNIISIHYQQL